MNNSLVYENVEFVTKKKKKIYTILSINVILLFYTWLKDLAGEHHQNPKLGSGGHVDA